jgi:hypothetical protein
MESRRKKPMKRMETRTITLTPELVIRVNEEARKNERTVSQEIRYQLEKTYKQGEGKKITA